MYYVIYQAVITSDELLIPFHGSIDDKRHKISLFWQREWKGVIESGLYIEGRKLYVYSDNSYILGP